MGKTLFKATAVVSGMTLFSRILGFVRDMLIARIFGVNLATDAFFVAFKLPNFLRRLFTEGAFSHAIVPIIAKHADQDDKTALRQFISKTAGTLAGLSLFITLIAMVIAPLIIMILAPGFSWQGQQIDLAVSLLRITLPFCLCIVLVAYAGAVLNAHDIFVIPSLTPAILNICMIAAALWLAPFMETPIMALAWGVVAAGIVQLLFQIPSLLSLGLLPRLRVRFNDRDVKQMLNKLVPAIFSSSITQINLLLDTLIASFLVSGSVSWLYYSDRLVEFPMGILGIGLATVILPNLANHHTLKDTNAFSSTLDWGLRLVLLVGLPATIGLFMLAEPMLSTLFQYNEFSTDDVHKAGMSLKAYSIGLLGYLFIRILVSGFTSRHDLNTPVRYGVYSMIASLALNIALVFPFAHAGLALATSLGALLNAALLLKKLLKDSIYQPGKGWLIFLGRVALASTLMALCLHYFVDETWWNLWGTADRIIHLLKWISIGGIVYALTLAVSGLRLQHLIVTSDRIARF